MLKNSLLLLIPLLLFGAEVCINPDSLSGQTLFLSCEDTLSVEWSDSLYALLPVDAHYDNFRRKDQTLDSVYYRVIHVFDSLSHIYPSKEVPDSGTFYLTTSISYDSTFLLPFEAVQITIVQDSTYLGYLSELINTPFIHCPKREYGVHQTEGRIGSDCAAFAIYGKRRMGYEIPYGGPHGIVDYLTPIHSGYASHISGDTATLIGDSQGKPIIIDSLDGVWPGDIVHFGEQVSVFYRDVGVKGVLDAHDLLLQNYMRGPELVSIRECGFFHASLRLYKWDLE